MRLSQSTNCEIKLVDGHRHYKAMKYNNMSQNSSCSKGKYCFVKLFNCISKYVKYENWLQCKMYVLLGGWVVIKTG